MNLNDDYKLLLQQAESLLSSETDQIANAANLASLIFHSIDRLNWVGFYFLRQSELVLGPFAGQVACNRIAIGKGVCGAAFAQAKTLIVDDVHQFPGHIACDAASESEIVVPFQAKSADLLSGVLDVDSPEIARFGQAEREFFERVAMLYSLTG